MSPPCGRASPPSARPVEIRSIGPNGDPRFTALLVGLGVRELSMTGKAIPRVKSRILSIDMHAAGRRAMMIMEQFDSGRIAALLDDFNETAG